jgi:F0F1-type ATP synthase alpha subunit
MGLDTEQIGVVVYSIDEMAQIIGLDDAKMSELLVCNLNVFSVVAALERTLTNVMLYAAANDVLQSDIVVRTFDEMLLHTGFDVLSTVIDPLGNVLLADNE